MAVLNRQKSNNWEEIETISLQNETFEGENIEKDGETSFIEKRQDESFNEEHDVFVANHSEKENSTAYKTRARKSTASPTSEDIMMLESTDQDSARTRFGKGSRRPSVDTLGDGKSITSQSDTRSYREKLKDRINVVKERAGVSAISTQKGSKYLQKNSRNAMLNRITDILLKEEADVKDALERHKKSKERKKQDILSVEKRNLHSSNQQLEQDVSYETSIEFFTKVWKSAEETGSTESILSSPNRDSDNIHTPNSGNDDGMKLLAADYLGLKETHLDPVEFKPSVILNDESRTKREQELLYCPLTDEVPIQQRISDNEPRNPKDEGLYVPVYPDVKLANMQKLHQRLINEKNMKWFGEDGELIRLPSPLEQVAYHLFLYEDDISDIVRFEPAVPFGMEQEELSNVYIHSDECYVLEFEIRDIDFSHHPLFGREHVLAKKLTQLHEKYEYRVNTGVVRRLASKLKALRTAHDNLKRIMETNDNEEMKIIQQERLFRYKMEIQETRRHRMLEGKNDNILLMNLLSTWKDLKRTRLSQGYTSSDVKLQIVKSNDAISAEEWQNEIKRQVKEIVEELKEQKKKVEDENKSENYASIDENLNDIDVKAVQKKVMEEVSESIPSPEEHSFTVTLIRQEITPDNEITNAMEIQRRALIGRSRVWFRIFYNGHEVCKSTPQLLEQHFTCTFNQKFSIRLQEWPETLSVQVFCDGVPSKGIFNDQPLAEIFIPIANSGATLDNVPTEKYEFSSTDEVGSGVRHSGVGSGVWFKLFPEDDKPICCYTSASITCKTAWGMNNGRVLSPPEYCFNKINAKTQSRENQTKTPSDVSTLKHWLKTAQLDPNDPSNVPLFELLKRSNSDVTEPKAFFNVDSVQKMFDFCSEEELTANPRFKLLNLRDRGEMEFKNWKAVPLREWEIPKDIFKNYEKRISSPELPFDTIGLGQLEIHRVWGQHSLSMLYDRILKLCKLSQQHRNTQDVIHEEKVPDIGTLGLTFMKLLQPKRPLRPRRKGRKRIPVKGLTGQEVKVIVNVVRAFEVPIRKDVDTLTTEDSISYVPVRPFVEVTFKGQTKRTVTADGPNPTWNQDLYFSLMGPNDGFQVSNMQSFSDSLHIHLFDEIIVDILEDERRRDTTIHQRLDRNWLGSLRIPFSTLYFNHQVEGTFQLYSPPFLLGYDRQVSLASSEQSYLRNSTFLTLFIIVQPPLSPPDPIMEHLECSEPSYLEQHLELWCKEVTHEILHRPVKTLVTDVSGKSVCVTRFFRAIAPPVIYENETTTAEMIARYVSLIPVSTSGALLFGHFNVWLMCDQTIKLLLGEREDHAILLCCFLMKLGLKAWLLFGNGIPHGHSAYVLTRHDAPLMTPVYNIWDPVTGLKYSSMDSFSPLHKVYCLINDENIWVNIQNEELVRRTNFDVSQRSDWWPAFGRGIAAPTTSIQPNSIEYGVTSNTDVHLLQDKIEKYLRDSIMKWRPTSRTVWNRYCIATLRKLLPIMEREACGLKQQSSSDHLNELQHILGSHKICGFPISQPFTNIKAIIEAVKSTGVHTNESPDVEFALAVYVHPYPNDVLSVWVYAVSLVARR